MESEKIILNGIGEVQICRSAKARNISIRIAPFKGIKVTLPHHASLKEAEDFLKEKKKWILKNLAQIRKYEARHRLIDETTPVSTHHHTLKILFEKRDNIGVIVTPLTLYIRFPEGTDLRTPRMQKIIHQALEHTLKLEAEAYLPQRLHELALQHGFSYRKVSLRNSKTRWGSCSPDNSINLSIHLMRLPNDLIDYVLLHELVHTVHKNHGKRFWQALEKIITDVKERRKRIRAYSIGMY